MNARRTADAVVRRLEAAIPVCGVSERGCGLCVGPVDGRGFVVGAPLEGGVGIAPGVRACGGGPESPEGLAAELRVRDDVGGRARRGASGRPSPQRSASRRAGVPAKAGPRAGTPSPESGPSRPSSASQ